MKLYVITRKDAAGSDEYQGHVIAAETENAARTMAADKAADEGNAVWLSRRQTYSTCIAEESCYSNPIIVQSDFNAG